MKDAAEIHAFFKGQPDSQHIATEGNVEAIVEWARKNRPQSVLEMGAGIGTLSYAVLANSDTRVDLYEDNREVCIPRLEENLKPFKGRYRLHDNYRILPETRVYDLIIVDGGAGRGNQGGFAGAAFSLISYLENAGAVFVEGNRIGQRSDVIEALRLKHIVKEVPVPGKLRGDVVEKGGVFFITTLERSWFKRELSYFKNKIALALRARAATQSS